MIHQAGSRRLLLCRPPQANLTRAFASSSSARPTTTTRDAPLPPLTNPVEQAIAAAQKEGAFQNLSGSGKPLPKGSDATTLVTGMSSSEMLSKKAEFEMRRAIRNKELDDIAGKGEKLKYKGTTGSSPTIGGGGGDGDGGDVLNKYILKETKPDMKTIQK